MADANQNLPRRPRRLRRDAATRALLQETRVTVDDLIWPLFVKDGEGDAEPVPSMPGVLRHTIAGLVDECREASEAGIKAVALFPGRRLLCSCLGWERARAAFYKALVT